MIAILGSLPAGEFVSPVFGTLLCLRFKSWNFFFFEDHLSLSWLLHHLACLRLHLPWLFHSLSPFCLFVLSISLIRVLFLPFFWQFSQFRQPLNFLCPLSYMAEGFSLHSLFLTNLFQFPTYSISPSWQLQGLAHWGASALFCPRCQLSQHQPIARMIQHTFFQYIFLWDGCKKGIFL